MEKLIEITREIKNTLNSVKENVAEMNYSYQAALDENQKLKKECKKAIEKIDKCLASISEIDNSNDTKADNNTSK